MHCGGNPFRPGRRIIQRTQSCSGESAVNSPTVVGASKHNCLRRDPAGVAGRQRGDRPPGMARSHRTRHARTAGATARRASTAPDAVQWFVGHPGDRRPTAGPTRSHAPHGCQWLIGRGRNPDPGSAAADGASSPPSRRREGGLPGHQASPTPRTARPFPDRGTRERPAAAAARAIVPPTDSDVLPVRPVQLALSLALTGLQLLTTCKDPWGSNDGGKGGRQRQAPRTTRSGSGQPARTAARITTTSAVTPTATRHDGGRPSEPASPSAISVHKRGPEPSDHHGFKGPGGETTPVCGTAVSRKDLRRQSLIARHRQRRPRQTSPTSDDPSRPAPAELRPGPSNLHDQYRIVHAPRSGDLALPAPRRHAPTQATAFRGHVLRITFARISAAKSDTYAK